MDITTTLNQIVALDIQDRIRLVQGILDSIAAEHVDPNLTEPQQQELDRRIDDYEANPDEVMTWAEVTASIKSGNDRTLLQ
jgi:putative addiction module component (TIGR02574 family)